MSVVIKTTEMQYRDANGVYHGINAVAEKKIADQEAALDQIIANAQGAVNDLETQSDTFVAAINQMLQTGTDPTLSRPNVAADAAACGNLESTLRFNLNGLKKTMIENTNPFSTDTVWVLNGTKGTYAKWYNSALIDISAYQGKLLWYNAAIYGWRSTGVYIPPVVFLDSNEDFISCDAQQDGSLQYAIEYSGVVPIPTNASYVVLTSGTNGATIEAKASIIDLTAQTPERINSANAVAVVEPLYNRSLSGAYLSSGERTSASGWYATPKCDIHEYTGKMLRFQAAQYMDKYTFIPAAVFLDSNSNVISFYIDEFGDDHAICMTKTKEIRIPEDAYYVAFTAFVSGLNVFWGHGYIYDGVTDNSKENRSSIDEIRNVLEKNGCEIIENETPFYTSQIYTYGGTKNAYAGWYQGLPINIGDKVGEEITYYACGYGTHNSSPNIPCAIFLDSNGDYLDSVETTFGDGDGDLHYGTVIVPSSAEYMILTSAYINAGKQSAFAFIKKPQAINNRIKNNNIKIVCIGDSITHGDYGSEPEGTPNDQLESYPWFIAQEMGLDYKRGWIDAEFSNTGFEIMNMGVNGSTPKTWYNSVWSRYENVFDYDNNRKIIVILMFGANVQFTDTVETDTSSTNSEIGYYKKIIENINTKSQGHVQIILATPTWVDPLRRSTHATYVVADNPIVKKLAAFYNLPCIKTFDELGLSSINTDTLQPIDGLHFGYFGYSRLGNFILSRVESLLSY